MNQNVSTQRVRELLDYAPESGEFRWRVNQNKVKAGSVAGSMNGQGYWHIQVDGRKYPAHLEAVTRAENLRRQREYMTRRPDGTWELSPQGKTGNCIGWTLDTDDNEVACATAQSNGSEQ